MHSFNVFVFIFVSMTLFSGPLFAADNTSKDNTSKNESLKLVIIFDDSGSMKGQRIELARKATYELLNSLSQAERVVNIESVSLIPLNALAPVVDGESVTVVPNSQRILTEKSPYPLLKKWVNEDSTDGYFLDADGDTVG